MNWLASIKSIKQGLIIVAGFSVCAVTAQPTPLIHLKFNNGTLTSLANSGSAGESFVEYAPNPNFSINTPLNGGAHAIDFGNSASTTALDANTGNIINAMKDLKSFTIMGWLNCRSTTTSPGGNRVISWYQPQNNADGVEVAVTPTGALSMGIKAYNDVIGVSSNSGKITANASALYNNWRFFAITYDETLGSEHVKFYFGSPTSKAVLDRSANHDRGPTGSNTAPSVTLGNFSLANRTTSVNAAFRGLMDEIRVFGSKTNGSGALNLPAIQSLQGTPPEPGQPGITYERWTGIPGTAISQLTSNSQFPDYPNTVSISPSFDAPINITNDYGARMSGWIQAPITGAYEFVMTSDDEGVAYLSTNSTKDNKQLIMSFGPWAPYTVWACTSQAIVLEAGRYYYIEALVKEGSGGDHLKVGWKRPSTTTFEVIGAPYLFVAPPATDIDYPSAYHLYEAGTISKKATMGWQKEDGNSHFYIEAEGNRSLKVQNGSVVVPELLTFGGNFPVDPNQNDLRFRWDRQELGDIGILSLETQGGRWALKAHAGSEMEPSVTFNERLNLKGLDIPEPDENPWSAAAQLHYYDGLNFYREQVQPEISESELFVEQSVFDGAGLLLSLSSRGSGSSVIWEDKTTLEGGRLSIKSEIPVLAQYADFSLNAYGLSFIDSSANLDSTAVTTIDAFRVTTDEVRAKVVRADDYVLTKKWKISEIPDYVFEKNYPLQSLDEVERFVQEKKHLPNLPSAKEMSEGVALGDLNLRILKTVEELTLHVISLEKELQVQKEKSLRLEKALQVVNPEQK